MKHRLLPFLFLLALPLTAWAASDTHGPEFARDLLFLASLLLAARLGGHVAVWASQPAVVGELVAGILVGVLASAAGADPVAIAERPLLALAAEVGVILLLFEVGLESTVGQMLRVGPSALLVAVLGVIAPFFLGWGVAALLEPDVGVYAHVFLGATLTATSVGITARVLQELGKSTTKEARIILGAAVVDDVLGLIILAAVSGVIGAVSAGTEPSAGPIAMIAGKALLFLGGGLALGVALTPTLYRNAARLRGGGVLLAVSLAFCFAMSGLAGLMGLAPIVGAFAAGLVLENAHYKPFLEQGEEELEHLIHPVVSFLAPLFFVTMGMKVDLSVFGDPSVLLLASGLIVAAVIGKQAAMFGVLDRGVAKLPVGLGMIPRGEVGLIFANIGLTLKIDGHPVIDDATFGAVVVMVVVTTLVTPPALAWALRRTPGSSDGPDQGASVAQATSGDA